MLSIQATLTGNHGFMTVLQDNEPLDTFRLVDYLADNSAVIVHNDCENGGKSVFSADKLELFSYFLEEVLKYSKKFNTTDISIMT
jgi:hypothetical protein